MHFVRYIFIGNAIYKFEFLKNTKNPTYCPSFIRLILKLNEFTNKI